MAVFETKGPQVEQTVFIFQNAPLALTHSEQSIISVASPLESVPYQRLKVQDCNAAGNFTS